SFGSLPMSVNVLTNAFPVGVSASASPDWEIPEMYFGKSPPMPFSRAGWAQSVNHTTLLGSMFSVFSAFTAARQFDGALTIGVTMSADCAPAAVSGPTRSLVFASNETILTLTPAASRDFLIAWEFGPHAAVSGWTSAAVLALR